jgi:proteasome lid subunit RPN8/RPN11
MLKNELLNEIKISCNKDAGLEICGFIVEDNNVYKFIQIENKHPNKENNFLISPRDYLVIKNKFKIIYLFHSHPDGGDFSKTDFQYQKYHNLNMLMYDVKNDVFKEMKCKY